MTNLIDFTALGELLGLKKTSMHAALRAGELPPAVQIGRRKRWRISTIEKWLEDRESTAHPDPIYRHRAEKAVAARIEKTAKKTGRPTKKEKIEGRKS